MKTTTTTFVGLDVDSKRIHVAVVSSTQEKPLQLQVPHEARAVRRLVKKLRGAAEGPLLACYEAGPTGFTLQRQLEELGLPCQVIAPSLIPRKAGERVKTDRRDALKLAELLQAGLLTEVAVPSDALEAVRDLCRAREDAQEDLTRCRHRLSKFLLRRGLRWTTGRKKWTHAHRAWLRGLEFKHEADRAVFETSLLTVEQHEERVKGLEEKLEHFAQQDPYREPVGFLCCFHGIATITAMTLVAELHDVERFESPRQLMAFLGLTPREHSSGDSTRRGAITKCGNAHARRVLVEAAWHARHRPQVGAGLRARRRGQPPEIIALATKCQLRLHRRYWRLVNAGKHSNQAVVAVARELVGFAWAALLARPAGLIP